MAVISNLFLRFESMVQMRLMLGLTFIMLAEGSSYEIPASDVARPRVDMGDLFSMFGPGSDVSGWSHMFNNIRELWKI